LDVDVAGVVRLRGLRPRSMKAPVSTHAAAGTRRRKFWGWGYEGGGPNEEQQDRIAQALAMRFGVALPAPVPVPRIEEISLRRPRIAPPAALAGLCSSEPETRAGHSYGKSFRDVVRALAREFPNPPDLVAFPASEANVVALLDWCTSAGVVAIPYGGGSSVVGGVEPCIEGERAVLSIDLGRLGRVIEIDRASRAARIQAGVLGPALEDQLRPHALTLRHFPQSFEVSSLGGWIATRSGGHFATLYTHIDEFVESLRVVTPTGVVESRRLPGSGAGPSPDRMFVGSEGILGVITEAWMRLQDRPRLRAAASVAFADFTRAAEAVRVISQSGLYPTNCRLLDANEAANSGAGDGSEHVLVLGFESADHDPAASMRRALEIARDHGGVAAPDAGGTRGDESGAREGAVGAWRQAFLNGPYLRDLLARLGMVSETFETAITWDRFPAFHRDVLAATEAAIREVCGAGMVSCRFTHVYPDGPAPYYSVIALGRQGSQLAQWAEIKAAASGVINAHGATITHHHAVGRDHRPWYDRQRPDGFARALAAAKAALDPGGILNPGVLIG
jgi:alkyldihydroxyacetonephosphate synthase